MSVDVYFLTHAHTYTQKKKKKLATVIIQAF